MRTLSGLKLNELENIMQEMNATKFRAKQIHNWIYSKSVSSIDEMTNLSKDFREELKSKFIVTETKIKIEIETESKIEGKGFHASGALPPEILSAGCLPKGVCESGKWMECVF